MNESKVISFRAHKALESWLVSAGQGFQGGKAEILKLILIRAALEQPSVGGLGQVINHIIGNNRQVTIGNTAVYAARLPLPTIHIIEDAAATKHQCLSEWCAVALFQWYLSFKQYQANHREQDPDWLTEYSRLYRERVGEMANVYTQKADQGGI